MVISLLAEHGLAGVRQTLHPVYDADSCCLASVSSIVLLVLRLAPNAAFTDTQAMRTAFAITRDLWQQSLTLYPESIASSRHADCGVKPLYGLPTRQCCPCTDATDILITGDSAGGVAALNAAGPLRTMLQPQLPR